MSRSFDECVTVSLSHGRVDDGSDKIADQHIRLMPGGSGISQCLRDSKMGLYLLSAASLLVLPIARQAEAIAALVYENQSKGAA